MSIVRCPKTHDLTLKGQFGMHQHKNPTESSVCRGGGGTGMWQTPAAKTRHTSLRHDDREHGPETCPRYDCTCGFYGYRTWLALAKSTGMALRYHPFLFHVTCIGEVILHEEGFRTQRYRIDYALTPPFPDENVGIWSFTPPTTASPVPYYHMAEQITQMEALGDIAKTLGFPILDRDSSLGCLECQIVNGWVEPEGRSVTMRCTCYSPDQDEQHGKQNRLHVYLEANQDGGKYALWKCSICGTLRPGPKREENDGQDR